MDKKFEKEIAKTYKKCSKHILRPESEYFYQKKVIDEKGTKYFINCIVYKDKGYDNRIEFNTFHFEAQFEKDGRSIDINTVSWTSDPKEKYRKYPKLKEVEDMFEKMRVAYGGEYYDIYY